MIYIDKEKNEIEKFKSLIKEYKEKYGIKTIVLNSSKIDLIKNLSEPDIKMVVSPITVDESLNEDLIKFLNKNKILFGNVEKKIHSSKLDSRNLFLKKVFQDSFNMLDKEIKNIVISASFALENDLIEFGETIIGLDEENGNLTTMVIIKPNYKNNIIKTKIIEIVTKPIVRN